MILVKSTLLLRQYWSLREAYEFNASFTPSQTRSKCLSARAARMFDIPRAEARLLLSRCTVFTYLNSAKDSLNDGA